jgi:hypothetical protein
MIQTREPTKADYFGKKTLVKMGQDCWANLYKGAADDNEVLERAQQHIINIVNNDPINGPVIVSTLISPDRFTGTLAAGRWVDQGLPVFRLGHKRLAALMATHVPVELADQIKPPFKAFFIEMPPDLLHLEDSDSPEGQQGVLRPEVKGIIVQSLYYTESKYGVTRINVPIWSWMAVTETRLVQWQVNRSTKELCSSGVSREPATNTDRLFGAFNLEMSDYDHRLTDLINRLICSVCLLVTGHKNDLKEKKETPHEKGRKLRAKNPPEFRVFTMGSPVSIDVRPALKEYLSGRRSTSPSVQFLVRGHWRNQVYGEQRLLRKLLWIEPFWKGPDGAVINAKSYDVAEHG